MPLRVFLLGVARAVPGEEGWTVFNFERNGRVNVVGNRREPFWKELTQGHLAWASTKDLEELAAQMEAAAEDQAASCEADR